MFGSTRQSSLHVLPVKCLCTALVAFAACLLPMFQPVRADAQGPPSVQASGRIYVGTLYHLKPEGADEDKTLHSAIVAIDPVAADWQLIVEEDATVGAGDAVRLSPDRRTLVFFRSSDGIWKCESDGQFPFKIFDYQGNGLLRPVWSGDGKHLVLTKTERVKKDSKQVLRAETWQIDADGRNAVKLPIPDTDSVEDWSPDGRWFVTVGGRHPGQLCLMKNDGTQDWTLTASGANWDGRFSPDGKKILHHHLTRAEGNSIRTVDVDGENATELVKEIGPAFPEGAFWSPDGKQIAVVLVDLEVDENGKKTRPRLDAADYRIETMDADGSNRRKIPLKGARFCFISAMGDWR